MLWAASTANIRFDSSGSPVINSGTDYLAYQAEMNEIKASQPQVISNEYGSYYMKDGVPIITYTFPDTWVGGKLYYSHSLILPEELQIYIYNLSELSETDYLTNLAIITYESGCQENAYNYYYDEYGEKREVYGLMQAVDIYWSAYTTEVGQYYDKCFPLREYAENNGVDLLLTNYDGVYDAFTNIYVGISAHSVWKDILDTQETKDYQALVGKYGNGKESRATYEILFYRDSLALLTGEETWYVGDLYTERGEKM